MSYTNNTCFVAQVLLGDSATPLYLCSSSRIAGITLNTSITYDPYILDIGNAEKVGNFGEGSSIGKMSMRLLLGQQQYQGAFNLDITRPWNNGTCTIKICDIDTDTTWALCEDYYTGIIKGFKIDSDNITFDVEDANTKDNQILPRSTVEDIVEDDSTLAIADIPEDSIGKHVPMQYGDLDDAANGQFAKGLLISNKIGFQKIYFDTESLFSLDSIGMWESGLKRYFTGKASGEYTIDTTTKKFIQFRVDSTTTLGEDLTATEGIETFAVADSSKLTWQTEEDYDNIDNYPEILSVNIIAINDELMLIVEQPAGNIVRVERGYGDTTVAVHSSGATIYQSAKFSARNLLSFSETFYPKAVSNFCYYRPLNTYNIITSGSWSNLLNTDNDDFIKLTNQAFASFDVAYSIINTDLRFEKVEDKFTCYGVYVLMKVYYDLGESTTLATSPQLWMNMISTNASFDALCPSWAGNENVHLVLFIDIPRGTRRQGLIDTITNPIRDYTYDAYYKYSPNLLNENEITGTEVTTDFTQALSFESLSSLNNKWKLNIQIDRGPVNAENYIQLYRIGFLIDFFASFVARRIIAPLTGRKITVDVQTILGMIAATGMLIERPWELLAHMLTTEMGYSTSDFDLTSWQGVVTYYTGLESSPTIAMSYGIDEKEKGWDLCQEIANQHLFMLTKTDSGKIKIVDLFRLQEETSTGYKSLTAYAISIDDIIISGGKRLISIQQTGTDRIRNVVKIKYNRNNSTDEYQNCFPGGEQGYTSDYCDTNETMKESGITLSQARTTYYNGQKTEALEIEAFSIYSWSIAYRLWKWHINDKAEVFFYITITLPYYHYSDINSKSSQYDIGDIIYIDGEYQGITFNSSHKFVIRNITKTDQGKEIIIEAKSIQPVSSF